jgi:hypothetical protein
MAYGHRDSAEAALERRSRWLLLAYPAAYRHERGDEIIATLLETTPAGRVWPRPRDARALVTGGLRARTAQNRRQSTAANLRVAVMAGISLYLVAFIASYLETIVTGLRMKQALGPHFWWVVLVSSLIAATVLLAWIAPRVIVRASGLAAGAALSVSYFVSGQDLSGPFVTPALSLALLVALVPRAGHPSPKWLWLISAFPAATVLDIVGQLRDGQFLLVNLGGLTRAVVFAGLAIGVVSIALIGIDARLAVAMTTSLTLSVAQWAESVAMDGSGWPGWSAPLPYLCIFAAVAATAIWMVRRQSARVIR